MDNDITTPHLELEIKHITERTPKFVADLSAFLQDQSDPTGLRISNLRMMAQHLRMNYEQIDGLLAILEEREGGREDRSI